MNALWKLTRDYLNELTDDERKHINNWLSADEKNRKEYERVIKEIEKADYLATAWDNLFTKKSILIRKKSVFAFSCIILILLVAIPFISQNTYDLHKSDYAKRDDKDTIMSIGDSILEFLQEYDIIAMKVFQLLKNTKSFDSLDNAVAIVCNNEIEEIESNKSYDSFAVSDNTAIKYIDTSFNSVSKVRKSIF